MSSPLKQNTTALQELLEKINQLPEAGNSGGGGGIIFKGATLEEIYAGTYKIVEGE
jgi:hypothetical protein